jgi:hypothetical protein
MRVPDAKSFLRLDSSPAVSTALGIGLAVYFAYHVTRFHLGNVWPLAPIGDASIFFEQGRLTFEVTAMWTIWMAALLWYMRRVARSYPLVVPSRAALADWTVLLLAPLPFSPWLEPYHAIPLVPGAILLVLTALDDRVSARDRKIAVGAWIALLATRAIALPFAVRGVVLLAQFLAVVVALGLLRRDPAAGPRGA